MSNNAPYNISASGGAVTIEGITISDFQESGNLVSTILQLAVYGKKATVCYANVHVLNIARRVSHVKRTLENADLVYCDGAGVVLASRLLGKALTRRHTAADWIWEFLSEGARRGIKVGFLAARPEIANKLIPVVDDRLPKHSIVFCHHGYFERGANEQRLFEKINESRCDVLMVGLGTPEQEHWIERNRSLLNVKVVCAIGACVDFMTGSVRRCPKCVGECGFEWAYRLYREPRRLFGRYVVGNAWFICRVLVQAIAQLGRPDQRKYDLQIQ